MPCPRDTSACPRPWKPRGHIARLPRGRSFGNARPARGLLETLITQQARRLGTLRAPSVDDLRTLPPQDLPTHPVGTAG
ncbi:hypothetical protein ABT010_17485 [Streptomyces sp. NPDC002668]|uniref:hypothetical protein n=1 Tax=Streptomyces sp. NPDC002668 TaxID=3154422 RepID=UPI003323D41A